MQLTFGDAEGLGKRKQTRREIFLAEMEQVVPWQQLLGLVAPHYPVSGRPGRQPYALATMLRIHLLQQWYALSDPAMEEALHEIPTLRRFAQLGGLDNVPDETTILNFRRVLETHGLAARMLEAVNAHLARKGQSLRSGTIVDATLIAAPSSTKNADHARDPEMHQTRKGNQWYFGKKAHIGVDEFSGLVRHVHCTAANVADVTVTHTLLHGKEDSVAATPVRTNAKNCRPARQHSSSPPGPRRCKPSATSGSVLGNSVGNTSRPACARRRSIRSG
ncbi:IS5 family transposase [Xanthomonas arboricola]|nr:IS5 family transposase [Xanthomonas campestris]